MRSPRVTTLTASAISAVLSVSVLAACTTSTVRGGTSSAMSSARPAPSTSTSASLSQTPVTQNSLPPASAIPNVVAKRNAIVVSKCAALPGGGWMAAGTVKNSGTTSTDYAITIFFTNEHATVQDFATTAVTVKPGATADWTASKKFAAATPTNCVLRGVG